MVDLHCGLRLYGSRWPDGDHFKRTLNPSGLRSKGFITVGRRAPVVTKSRV